MDKHYELCSFDVEYLEEPVKPVIHNIPKLLFFTEGIGKIRIYNKEFNIVPNTLLMIFPWEIVEIIQVEKPLAIMKISYNSVFNNLILNSLNRYKKSKNNIFSLIKKIPVVYFNKIEAKTIKNIFYEIKNEVGLESLSDFKPFFDIKKEDRAIKEEFDLSTVYITNKLTELIILIAKKNINEEKNSNIKEESEEESPSEPEEPQVETEKVEEKLREAEELLKKIQDPILKSNANETLTGLKNNLLFFVPTHPLFA